MKTNFKHYSFALLSTLMATACSNTDISSGNGPQWGGADVSQQYVVISSSGESNGVYIQQVTDPTHGLLNATQNTNNRIFNDGGNNIDFVSYGNKYLIAMAYPSQGGSTSSYMTRAYTLDDNGNVVQHGSSLALDGDVKARGIYNNYLIGMSDQTEAKSDGTTGHYERVKYIQLDNFNRAVVDGNIRSDNYNAEPNILMKKNEKSEAEAWGIGDIAQYGDYVLVSYATKRRQADNAATRAKTTFSTELANNLYLGVYKFDPNDTQKEYLKYQHTLVRKSEDHAGKEAGQIKGNLRSRTESGIEVVGDDIYLFCQSTVANYGKSAPEVPSAILRISGNNIQNGKPVGIDDDYYVNLVDVTGHYMWKTFYLGDNKFCMQLYTQPGTAGVAEGSHYKFGIFDVKTLQYQEVTGLPDAATIEDIALANAIDTEKHTLTIEIQHNNNQKPALYTIGADGIATRGMEVTTEAINGVGLLKK